MISLSIAGAAATSQNGGVMTLFVIALLAVAVWFGLRTILRSLRAGKAAAAVGADFRAYALEALVNAAKIDGLINESERAAITQTMVDLTGAPFETSAVEAAFARAHLSKDELVAYLADRAGTFSRAQKTALLKALLSVFVADGKFDETEHAALVDYTAAVGFDRQSAPEMLRRISQDFVRGSIT